MQTTGAQQLAARDARVILPLMVTLPDLADHDRTVEWVAADLYRYPTGAEQLRVSWGGASRLYVRYSDTTGIMR